MELYSYHGAKTRSYRRILYMKKLWFLFFLFIPFFTIRISIITFSITISMILSLIILIYYLPKNKFSVNYPRNSAMLFLIIFLLYVTVGVLYSLNRIGGFSYVIGLIYGFVILILIFSYFYNKEYEKYMFILLISTSVLCIILIYKYLVVFKVDYIGLNLNYPTKESKNSLYFFLALINPISIMYILEKMKLKFSFLLVIFPIIIIIALFYTGSRGAWISVFVAMVVPIIINFKQTRKFIVIIPILIVLMVSFSTTYQKDRLMSIFSSEGTKTDMNSTKVREDLLYLGIDKLSERPLFGWGTNSFAKLAPNTGVLSGKVSHNDYLKIIVENGIIGILLLLLFIITIIKYAIFTIKNSNIWYELGVGCSVISGLIYLLFINAIENYLLWIIIGLLMVNVNRIKSRNTYKLTDTHLY